MAKRSDTREVLMKARALIAEKGWTQGLDRWSVDKHGRRVEFASAVRNTDCAFCAEGALIAASGNDAEVADEAERALAVAVGAYSLIAWNEAFGRTKEEVLAAFDKAIAAAEGGAHPQ